MYLSGFNLPNASSKLDDRFDVQLDELLDICPDDLNEAGPAPRNGMNQ